MYKVMIVDDMEVMRKRIKRLPLWGENTGFSIIDEAEDGHEALCKLQTQSVDLLITDIKMPRINGIELLREVHENCLATCVVFLSEYGEFSFAKEAIEHGIFDYLVKPVKLEELEVLLGKVKKCIREKEQTHDKLKKLEDKLIEKVHVYYPDSQLTSIIQYISDGNNKALEAVSKMGKDTAAALGNDRLKTAIVLQKAYNEIWSAVQREHTWIGLYVDIKTFNEINLTQYDSIDLMIKKLAEMILAIILVVNKFILDSKNSPLVREICNYVIKNVEKEMNIGKISETLFLTKNYIGDIFKKETGMTVGEYITMAKIERAMQLIAKGTLRSYEIAQILGYNNIEYFAKVFKKSTGLSPMEFKNTLRAQCR